MAKVIKRVGIRELKSKLSSYLREIRAGATILVLDRNDCVAEMRQPSPEYDSPVIQVWVASGEMVPPVNKKRRLVRSPVSVSTDLARKLLDAERGE